jgi:hypothetical protein
MFKADLRSAENDIRASAEPASMAFAIRMTGQAAMATTAAKEHIAISNGPRFMVVEYNPNIDILEPQGGRMSTRAMSLPTGWYPSERREVEARLDAWNRVDEAARAEGAASAIAPHAGWYYSGRIAWSAWSSAAESDTVVIIGGHLPAGSDFRYYAEEGFATPIGAVAADRALTDAVARAVKAVPDRSADNTVEVHMPMAAYKFPKARMACFRAPNDARAADLGRAIADFADASGGRVFVLGSTDLTHYGRAYGFEPDGPGPEGFAWARRADKAIVEAFVAMDGAMALTKAGEDGSACSVGAAVAAIAYAKRRGALRSRMLMRGSSDEIAPGGDSSVGYCAVAFMR